MSARVRWEGLDELRAELRRLPSDLAQEAGGIVDEAATSAADAARAEYDRHRVTGHLANAVKVQREPSSQFGVSVVVRNTDPIAWLFDNGSQARHWISGKATGQMWGKTPPTHIFVRSMIRARRAMYETLKGMLERHGLKVSGDA